MCDVKCPYCKKSQEINHDDGYGYTEGVDYTQDCVDCGKEFKFTASISIDYEVFCADGEHDLEQSPIEKYSNHYNCSKCDYYEVR